MGENDISDDNPLKQTFEDRLERELNNIHHVYMGIDRRLEEIANAVEANTANIEILEEAISGLTDIPTRKLRIRYVHDDKKLWINERFFLRFEGKEAEVFGLMFFKTSGLPKTTKFQCSEVAEKLSDLASGTKVTSKAIGATVKRIEAKLNGRLNTKNLLTVKTKEFYFSPN